MARASPGSPPRPGTRCGCSKRSRAPRHRPLAWAGEIGPDQVLTVLDNLAQVYGEDLYRASPPLRRLVARDRLFHR